MRGSVFFFLQFTVAAAAALCLVFAFRARFCVSETSLNSEERSLPIEPASEIPPGEVGSSIAAQVAVIIQTNKVRMPTAAIVMQQADVMENQYQVPRYRSTCNYGFSDLRYEYMT